MYQLFDELLEGIESDITEVELESAIGAGQGIISHQRRVNSDLSFVNVLRSVMYIRPEKERSTMEDFIKSFTSENNLRVSIEYALSNRDFGLCDWIMEKLKDIGKAKNIDWVKTYEIVKSFQKRELSLTQLDSLVKEHKPKNLETRVLTNILKCYVHFYKQNWVDIQEMIPQIREDISTIKNDYIRSTFSIRLNELSSHIELHFKNNVERARELVEQVKESEFTFKFNLHVHYILGKSYMLEDYDKSLSHLEEYVRELRKQGDESTATNVENMDIAFLKNHWGVDFEGTNDEAEQMYLEYVRGNITKSKELLKNLEDKGELSPFQQYYKGLIEQSGETLMESMMDFINKGDFFFAQVPKRIIENLPFVEQVYETMRRNYDEIEI
jgi:hypothetical protein